jgi:uncharacterized damage-inducible protein DinB
MADRELLRSLAAFRGAFQPPAVVLEGLSEEQAAARPHGVPHSIAEVVGHMWYWQDLFNRCALEGFRGVPEHAEGGWPKVAPGEWDAMRDRFFATVELTQQLAANCDRLDEKLLPEDSPLPFLKRETIGSGLLHGVVHSSHHLGQIITLRQLMGLWPPKAGSLTW